MTWEQFENTLTKEQQEGLRKVFDRKDLGISWDAFVESAHLDFTGALMVPWCGMWLGIEKDGYTHS